MDLSAVVGSRGHSLVAVHGLLIVEASPVAEHRLCSSQESEVVKCGFSSSGP